MYNLHDSDGFVDVAVGDGNHQWNLTNIAGSASITAGDGDCIFNVYNLEGALTGVLGNGNDQITLENVAAEFHLTSGNGDHNIVGTAMRSFTATLGNGDDNLHLVGTVGSIHVASGDGLHRGTFETTSGSIKLELGKGNHYLTTRDTSDGDISIKAGKSYGKGVFDILRTINGDVSIMSGGGRTNNVTVANTEDGSTSNGDVSIIIGPGSCTIEASHANGDVYIDLQGSGSDFVDVLDVRGSMDVRTWEDNDIVTVNKLHGSLLIDLGDGDDKIDVHYLGGNGTLLGGIGDDRLMLDPRGSAGDPINTMDGSYISWNGGTGSDSVEMYLVPAGSINLNFYNMESNQIYTRCSDEGDLFNPSFSTGLQTQSVLDSLSGYLYVFVYECCAAHFSWDTSCGENSGRQLTSQTELDLSPPIIWYYPQNHEYTCYAKLLSEFDAEEVNKFPTKNECCIENFGSDLGTCCQKGSGKCSVLYTPNWTAKTCQPRISSDVRQLESDQASNTFEECCKKRRSQFFLDFCIIPLKLLTNNPLSLTL